MALREIKENDARPLKLFFQDEARFGRINNVSRCWVKRKDRAVVAKQIIREYIYAYTAVCPKTGETVSLVMPYSNTEIMNIFLRELSQQQSNSRILMVLDGAGWHTSNLLDIPANIELLPLPAYSPELNPVEHIWDYIREQKGFNNYTFDTINDVEDKLCKALSQIILEKEILKSLCNFNWINSASC